MHLIPFQFRDHVNSALKDKLTSHLLSPLFILGNLGGKQNSQNYRFDSELITSGVTDVFVHRILQPRMDSHLSIMRDLFRTSSTQHSTRVILTISTR